METGTSEIHERLKKIMYGRFNMEPGAAGEDVADKELMGSEMQISPRAMLYIYMDIEKEFGIAIPEEDIISGKFNTLNNIAGIIKNQIRLSL